MILRDVGDTNYIMLLKLIGDAGSGYGRDFFHSQNNFGYKTFNEKGLKIKGYGYGRSAIHKFEISLLFQYQNNSLLCYLLP